MTEIDVQTEEEADRRWRYQVALRDGEATRRYEVTLGWSDYDLWSHGRVPPQRVVEATFEFLLEREPAAEILPQFDCALVRRYFPEVDRELPGRL